MRKFFWMLFIPVLFLTGCHDAETAPVSGKLEVIREQASETEQETETQPLSIAERADLFRDAEHQHIYDECHALTETETELHNNYLEWIASSRLANAFVVITDALNGSSPEQFAEAYYQTVSDPAIPDGFLVLINNDTNRDVIYTAGRYRAAMPQTEIAVTLSGATYQLIEGNYADALNQILPLSEKLPAYVLDRTGTLTESELLEFSAKIQSLQEEKEIQCAIVLHPFPEDGEPDAEFYQQHFACDALLMLDPAKKLCRTYGTGNPDSEILKIWESQSLPWAIRFFLEAV